MAQVAIFKEIFDQVRKDLDCELFYSELKRHNVSHYIYYLATDNIHIVLENDNTVLIKGLKKVVNVKFSRNTHLIETSYDRLKSREITFSNTGKILLKQEFSDGLQISMNIKDITIRFDNSLLFTESIQNTTQIFPLKSPTRPVSSVSAPGRWHNAIRVRAKPCVHRFNYSRTLHIEKFPVRAVDIVNPGIQ